MSSSPDPCSCSPGACHGGHTIQIGGTTCDRDGCPAALPGVPPADRTAEHEEWAELAGWHLANKYMPTDRCPDHWPTDGDVEQQADRLADERLTQFRDDEYVCVTDDVRSMAAELLALRAYATDHEGRCVDIGLERCEACGRPRFSDRHLAQVTRERDEARELVAYLQRAGEIETLRVQVDTFVKVADRLGDMVTKVVALIDADPEDADQTPAHVDRVVAEHLALRARITELEGERDQHAETARQATNHAINSTATIATIRHALAGHPRCEEHPEGDVMKCGWKRAVASVQAAVDATEVTK